MHNCVNNEFPWSVHLGYYGNMHMYEKTRSLGTKSALCKRIFGPKMKELQWQKREIPSPV